MTAGCRAKLSWRELTETNGECLILADFVAKVVGGFPEE
jgi:hypothetical protein